jgi:predicted MFS family arabinose efflux permease
MTESKPIAADAIGGRERERLLRLLAVTTFIVFFQAYMVAPVIPALSNVFRTSVETVGLIIPAYLIPYGIATLAYGPLADRIGIHRVMFASLAAFATLAMLTATAQSIEQLALWRIVTGIGASGVVPLALALVGRLYPYEQRGRPLGWLFGAMAGGMAFGSPLGAMIVPFVGWQGLFLFVGSQRCGAAGPSAQWGCRRRQGSAGDRFVPRSLTRLQGLARHAARTAHLWLCFPQLDVPLWRIHLARSVFRAAIRHRPRRHRLGAPWLWRARIPARPADWPGGRPLGPCEVASLRPRGQRHRGAVPMLGIPLILAPVVAMALSLGYDMTQPLFGGIVTSPGGKRAGQAMGLNVFTLFVGFGLGSLAFGALLQFGFEAAFGLFTIVELAIALLSFVLFRSEVPTRAALSASRT